MKAISSPIVICVCLMGIPDLVLGQEEVRDEISDTIDRLRNLEDLDVSTEIRFITLNDTFFERIGVDFNVMVPNSGVYDDILKNGYGTRIGGVIPLSPDLDSPFGGTFEPIADVRYSWSHCRPKGEVGLNQIGGREYFLEDADFHLFRAGWGGFWALPTNSNNEWRIGLVGGPTLGGIFGETRVGAFDPNDRQVIIDKPKERGLAWGGEVEAVVELLKVDQNFRVQAYTGYGALKSDAFTGKSQGSTYFYAGFAVVMDSELIWRNDLGSGVVTWVMDAGSRTIQGAFEMPLSILP